MLFTCMLKRCAWKSNSLITVKKSVTAAAPEAVSGLVIKKPKIDSMDHLLIMLKYPNKLVAIPAFLLPGKRF